MKKSKMLTLKFERNIPATPGEVFNAWLKSKTPGIPWYENKKIILQPKVNGFFYWLIGDTSHYGRFTKIQRPGLIQHTWMSFYTEGRESLVTLTFKKKGADTLMTLVHSGLPNNKHGMAHKEGWDYFLNKLVKTYKAKARR